jgi:putative DNA primase/helicase
MAAATCPPNDTTDPVQRVLDRLDGVRRSGDSWTGRCPSHDDRQPSLSVSYGAGGRALVNCFKNCPIKKIVADLGLTMADLFPSTERRNGKVESRFARPIYMAGRAKQQSEQAEKPPARETGRIKYEIRDLDGTLIIVHERVEYDDGSKQCFWQKPKGGYGLDGRKIDTLPLYGSERLAALPDGATVVVCEGEKATDAARQAGLNAVGTVTGAGTAPTSEVLRCLKRFDVVLWPDNDDSGRAHMGMVAERLLALEVRS